MTINNDPINISVILPVYLSEASVDSLSQLTMAIDSVLNQHYPNEREVIIIDNGPVNIEEQLKKINYSHDNELKIIKTTQSNGLVYALNVGLVTAKYNWIARIDADDTWCAGKIEAQINHLYSDNDITIVGTGMNVVYNNSERVDIHIRPNGWKEINNFFVETGCPFPHGSILARKLVFIELGGYSHNVHTAHCEDYALWGVWLRFFKPAMVESALYNYNISNSQISSKFSNQQSLASSYVVKKFLNLSNRNILPDLFYKLSLVLGIELIYASILCYRLWTYRYKRIYIPKTAVGIIRAILVDLTLVEVEKKNVDCYLDESMIMAEFELNSNELSNCERILISII